MGDVGHLEKAAEHAFLAAISDTNLSCEAEAVACSPYAGTATWTAAVSALLPDPQPLEESTRAAERCLSAACFGAEDAFQLMCGGSWFIIALGGWPVRTSLSLSLSLTLSPLSLPLPATGR